jgi:hypothetical protein
MVSPTYSKFKDLAIASGDTPASSWAIPNLIRMAWSLDGFAAKAAVAFETTSE